MTPRGDATPTQKRLVQLLVRDADTSRHKLIQGLREVHAEGVSIRALAELTGRSTNTIQRWLRED